MAQKRVQSPQGTPDIGPAIQKERKSRRMTLEQLSARSGVSRSMLSQIERGEANPTFAVLWSLTRGLAISLSDLVGDGGPPATGDRVEVTTNDHTPEIRTSDGLCRLRILGPARLAGRTEWYDVEMQSTGSLVNDAHAPGTLESFTAVSGRFEVTSGGSSASVAEGETARYPVDVPHSISNVGDGPARGFLVVLYP